MFTPDPSPLDIEVLVLPDTTLILVAAVIEPLRAANRVLGREQFRWCLTTPDGAPAPTRAGVPIPAVRVSTVAATVSPLDINSLSPVRFPSTTIAGSRIPGASMAACRAPAAPS